MTRQTSLRRFAAFAAAWCTILAAGQAAAQTRELGASGTLLDGIAAVVDDGVVLKSELDQRMTLIVTVARQNNQRLPALSVLEQQVLDQLIIEQVQLQRAQRVGIQVSDQVLNQALSNYAANVGLTLEQLPAALAAEGSDYALFREDLRRDITMNELQRRDVLGRVSISPRELDLCINRLESSQMNELDYNVSHIMINIPNDPDGAAEVRELVEEIYEQLENGADFGQLAIAYSDAQTALEGGSLGWRQGSQLPTVFGDIVLRMRPGEVADPIQSSNSIQIVRLNEVRGAERVMEDQIRVRHILLRPNEILDDDAVQQRLIGIRNRILAGDEFGPIARAVSEDPESGADGGNLGWTGEGAFVPEFEEVLATLPVGELSEPFRTRFGWHIAEIVETRSHDMTEDLKQARCVEQIRESKAEEELEMWLRRLRDQAYVDVKL